MCDRAGSGFPGRHCPGLIEAARGTRNAWGSRRGFRGVIAPASLKRTDAESEISSPCSFPGCRCPGLIEATRIDNRARPRPGCFRGGAAPASLKQVIALRVHQGVDLGFRGVIAPASLKQWNHWWHRPHWSSRFPGRHCPGLIEARRQRPRICRAASPISGASLPRPH